MKFKSAACLIELGFKVRRKEWEKGSWIGRMGFNMRPDISHSDLVNDDWDILEENGFLTLIVELHEELRDRPDLQIAIINSLRKKETFDP